MKFKRHKSSTKKVKGSRRERQHSPPAVDKTKLRAHAPDDAKVTKPKPKPKPKKPKRKEELGGNTPRAFMHLMNRINPTTSHTSSTLANTDDPAERKRRKLAAKKAATRAAAEQDKEKNAAQLRADLTLRPGESAADFNRRVDEALPVIKARSGVPSAGAVRQAKKRAIAEANGQKPVLTKKQRKALNKDGMLGDDDDDGEDYSDEEAEERRYAELKNKRSNSPDPWKKLTRAPPPKFGEVADAPPMLKPPSKKLVNVPKKAAGSDAERMQLEAERENVIARYRAIADRKQIKLGLF
ncbi:hypothetical protein V1512DRAFT_257524 [Lipomyces arxii]|uniref:uncharacterized protein n=1 Tax=Lipomyces arxii TaxID=56418 RepID=UPI0034CD9C03